MTRAALIAGAIVLAASAATAQPHVSFLPAAVMVQPNQQFDLSFQVGECADSIASFQLYMSFDPTKVQLLQATEGALYSESGYMTWFISEQVSPGFWRFFDTVFGAGTHVTPPGELLHLRFKALVCGHTQAHVDTVRMTDVRRDALPVEGLEHGEIFVVLATGVGDETPSPVWLGPASPNPFAGSVTVPFTAPPARGPLAAVVYDARGRVVADLAAEGSGTGTLVWDGRCADGREAPSAVYFVRISAEGAEAHTRVVKVK